MENFVYNFSIRNKDLIKILHEKSVTIEGIDHIVKELYQIHNKIIHIFSRIENIFTKGNMDHLTTYKKYLDYCVNMKNSRQIIEKKIKKRVNKSSYLKEIFENSKIEYENKNNKVLITLSTLDGEIKTTFGKTGIKNFNIPQKIDDFIPDPHKEWHKTVLENFINQPLNPSLEGEGIGFIKIEKNFILPVKIQKKIVPFNYLGEDILIAASILFEINDTNCYALIDGELNITGISYFYKKYFSAQYVQNVKNISVQLYNDLKIKMEKKNFKKDSE